MTATERTARSVVALALAAACLLPPAAHATTEDKAAPTIHRCATDEGPDGQTGPLPCVYDARHMGNGSGHSFLIRKPKAGEKYGELVLITHRRAHRLFISVGSGGVGCDLCGGA